MQASAIGFAGSTVTNAVSRPRIASDMETLASPPPKVASKAGDCRRRSRPGGLRRSKTSPRVTIRGFVIGPLFSRGARVFDQLDCLSCKLPNAIKLCLRNHPLSSNKTTRARKDGGQTQVIDEIRLGDPTRGNELDFGIRFGNGPKKSHSA